MTEIEIVMKLYTDIIRQWYLGAAAVALLACAGCSDDIIENGNGIATTPSDCLAFTTCLTSENTSSATRSAVSNLGIVEERWDVQLESQKNGTATRASLTNHLSGEAGVIGYQYDDGDTEKTPINRDDNNIEFTFDGDKLNSTNTTILWKSIKQDHLDIYAYAPYDMAATDNMSLDYKAAPPVITYTVPDKMDDQKDLLVAKWTSTEPNSEHEDPDYYRNKTIPLTFDHALTAIHFKVGFACQVHSVKINGVYNKGTYDFTNEEWKVGESSTSSYEIDIPDVDNNFEEGESLPHNDDYLILMPQTLPDDAEIVFNCTVDGEDKEYKTNIKGNVWEPGKLITYTFYRRKAPGTIYLDLAAADIKIDGEKYSGAVYKDGQLVEISEEEYNKGDYFYIYQSTEANRSEIWKGSVCTPPIYDAVKSPDGTTSWREFITNNTDVDQVIESWDANHETLVNAAGRTATKNRIHITGNVNCHLTIDNIYTTYQDKTPQARRTAGLFFEPTGSNAELTVHIAGDNRLGAVHYYNKTEGNQIIFEGSGSLTVADVDGVTQGGSDDPDNMVGVNSGEKGYWNNHWSSAIGGTDNNQNEEAYGIVINSGIIFAGTTKAENCTAIGGGGNAHGDVTINGGTVTAVATTTGTAIGGGIGFNVQGGTGTVTIMGGNVYAYNHANRWDIPSSAIGGAGSKKSYGSQGTVNISGGYVYAESALGTAIGGGSSYSVRGGSASVTISGGEVFAKTRSEISASIGGGTACSSTNTTAAYNGGDAYITIYGNPIVRTGSVGGGGTGAAKGHIGNATIDISGNADIQAQFLLSAGTGEGNTPTFNMRGGMIRNSNTADTDYLHVKKDGGAVYLENGTVTISGGTIKSCSAERGGAIYIDGTSSNGTTSNASFTMTGGSIADNEAIGVDDPNSVGNSGGGGAVYIIDGTVKLTGGAITDNLAAGGNGGGIFIRRGSLTVNGASITENSSEVRSSNSNVYGGGNGGGIYIYSKVADVDVDLISGMITGNTADRRGGGLCVIQDSDNHKAKITVGTENGNNSNLKISGNHCLLQGGGLYARGANADITINSGTIMNNSVSQYAHNPDVANDLGSVTLNGGDVKHNVVTFNANYDGANPATSVQNIVTETNSRLVAPTFTRMGYTFTGWNTKPSGSGESYNDGQVMNISKDITLYAQWTSW